MKRFKKATKLITTAFAFCLLLCVSMVAEAATYKPGTVYVNPHTNSKQEYYSVLKMRMSTYSDTDDDAIRVIYPKGATLSVKSNKKALQATITSQTYECSHNENVKVYIAATPDPTAVAEHTKYYYLTKNGEPWELELEEGTNRYYKELSGHRVYLTPNRTEIHDVPYAVKVAELSAYTGEYWYYYYDDKHEGEDGYEDGYYDNVYLYNDGDGKGYYYKSYKGSILVNEQVQETPDGQADYEYSEAMVKLTSTKAGSYTVSISANGQTQKLKVYVTTYGGDRIVSATLDKTSLTKSTRKASDKNITTKYVDGYDKYGNPDRAYKVKSSLKSGKLKIKADKGIKITGLIVATVDKNGKAVYKKVKNGGKISLSQTLAYKSTSTSGYYSRDSKKHTYVYVSYKDKNQGTSTTYAVTNKHGKKEIKRTIKYASNSKKYVDYLTYGYNADMDIWSY